MKKFFISIAVIIVSAGAIGSCAALLSPVAEKVADGVEKYCEEPYSFRSIYRNTVNAELVGTGHTVHVHCSGDPEPE
jgi:hypothetical protein